MNEADITRFLAIDVMDWGKGALREMPAIDGTWYPTDMNFIAWFRPIHEIAHAFMVVEKMLEMELVDSFDVNFDKGEAWLAIFTTNPLDFIEGFAEKLPKAICIAAVRALATDEQIASWL